jgi:simple sugar transport system permease protein
MTESRTIQTQHAAIPFWRSTHLLWPLLTLALLLLFNLAFTPGFFHVEVKDGHLYGSLVDVVNRAAPVMLLALGMTLVVATKGVDLSVGAVMAITGALAALLIVEYHAPLPVVLCLPLAVALVCGIWNGLLVAVLDIQPIVATLILMVVGRGIAQLITNGQILTFDNKAFQFIGQGHLFGVPFSVTLVALTLLAVGLATRRTAFGLFIEALGNNEPASRYAGVRTTAVKIGVYAFCGLCAGLAGLIPVSDIQGADSNNAGLYLELDAILSVVLGGTSLNGGRFYLVGSLIGALIIQTLATTILSRGVAVQLTLVVKAGVVLIVCLIQSSAFRSSLARAFKRGTA